MKDKFEKLLASKLGLIFADDDPVWCTARRVLITGGIRAGKTTRGAFKAFKEALNPAVKLIWLVGPDYVQAQEEFRMITEWGLEMNLIDPRSIRAPTTGSRTLVFRTGCRIVTKSAKHPETLASVAPDGIVLCEPGQMSGEVFSTCLGRLSQKRGWLFMGGTLEDDLSKPRWAWYEDKAVEWMGNSEKSQERAFSLPTWSNRILYPKGEDEPELVDIRNKISDYKWQRTYAGQPMGVEHPVFPSLWESYSRGELFTVPEQGLTYSDGAIGVDYGRTFEHPSAVVVLQEDHYGRYWVRHAWKGYKSDVTEISSVVHSLQRNFSVWRGAVDPNQGILGDILGFMVTPGGSSGGKPTETRISLLNGLLETRALYFDATGQGVEDVWFSMRLCARVKKDSGEYSYNRPEGDDLAQALMYAVWAVRGNYVELPEFDTGGFRMSYIPSGHRESRV